MLITGWPPEFGSVHGVLIPFAALLVYTHANKDQMSWTKVGLHSLKPLESLEMDVYFKFP